MIAAAEGDFGSPRRQGYRIRGRLRKVMMRPVAAQQWRCARPRGPSWASARQTDKSWPRSQLLALVPCQDRRWHAA